MPKDRQAVTRLAEPSVSLVILYDCDSKPCLDPEGKAPVDLNHPPSLDQARAMLGNAVSIKHKACVFHYAAKQPPAASSTYITSPSRVLLVVTSPFTVKLDKLEKPGSRSGAKKLPFWPVFGSANAKCINYTAEHLSFE